MIRSAIVSCHQVPLFWLPRIPLHSLPIASSPRNLHSKALSRASASMSSTQAIPVKPLTTAAIGLSRGEEQLRVLLVDVARYIDESKEIKERLELRFAGGWVRDKLLGIPSHDIDTAINVMTGYSFALKMREYLNDPGNMEKHGLVANDIGNLHKIAANPEKSKHLETVTTKLLGFDVDFVNLRKETYTENSRTPQMEFGSAQEDALRRDATVNALFFNLHTRVVEDYTGGLDDLRSELIKTPLEPYQTFLDDPLRVLRLIRFASRLGFKIHADSEACMEDTWIKGALRVKISRERIGTEIGKMLSGQNPRCALNLLDRLGLYSTIFTDPTLEGVAEPLTTHWMHAYNCLEMMRSNESPRPIYKLLVRSEDTAEIAWILAALSPWAEIPTPSPKKTGGKMPLPFATVVAREGIKLNNRVCDIVTAAFRNFQEITSFKDAIANQEPWIHERDRLGMAIRRWEGTGSQWRSQVLLAIVVEAMRYVKSDEYEPILLGWHKFLDHLVEMDLIDAPNCKRLVDGTQLAKALAVKPGKWMAGALDVCMAWQFRNPTVADPTGAIEEVRKRATELQIPCGIQEPVSNKHGQLS